MYITLAIVNEAPGGITPFTNTSPDFTPSILNEMLHSPPIIESE